MNFPNGQVIDQVDLLNSMMSDIIGDDVFNQVNTVFLTQDQSVRHLNDPACQAEDALRYNYSINSGFLRLQQAFRYLGFKSNEKPITRFPLNAGGEHSRLMTDGSEVLWNDRPNDIYEDEDFDGSAIGWTINTFISEVLAWAKAYQIDRIFEADSPFEFKPLSIAVMNSKGGSYKTTTTVNFSVNCVLAGFRVLVIDGDPQSTASTLLGYPMAQHPVDHPNSLYETLIAFTENEDEFDIADFARPSQFSNLSIITGSTNGSLLDMLLLDDKDLLDRFIDKVKASGLYDLIITDTRPQSTTQDFAQYHAADVLIDTLPANTTGIGSTKQGLLNFVRYCFSDRGEDTVFKHKNRLSILSPTGVETDSRVTSNNVYLKLLVHTNGTAEPYLSSMAYIPKSDNIARAASSMQTVFQETNINVAASKSRKVLDAISQQFEEIFEKAIVPHYLKFSGNTVDSKWLESAIGKIGSPFQYEGEEYQFRDLGFAWAIIRPSEDAEIKRKVSGKGTVNPNPKRYLTASDIGLEEGHQIVMKDGEFKALDYDLVTIKPLTPYVFRHNTGS